MPVTPLRVWVLSDRQPGHYNLSRGIVAALALGRPVEEHWLALQLRVGLARNLMRWMLNYLPFPLPLCWLKLFYAMPALPQTPCDLIVSAGGKTSFANAWLARRLHSANIFAGSLRRLSPTLFDTVVTLEPIDPPAANNLVVELPPSAIDTRRINRAGLALRAQLGLTGQRIWTLMLGGDGAGYRYSEHDWQQLAQLLNRLASVHGIRWLLVGSRRTGAAAQQLLSAAVAQGHVAASRWYGQGGNGGIDAWLGAADRLFVSEDSMTMLAEAVYSRRPVISLRPASVAPTQRYASMIERFAHSGWIRRYAIDDLASGRRALDEVTYNLLGTTPLTALSQQLYERLPLQQPQDNTGRLG